MGNSNLSSSFCGEPLMKDNSIYNSSTIPNVSVCFQHTILVFAPCFFYWLLFPALMMQAKRSRNANRFLSLPISLLFSLKIIIAAVLFFDAIFIFTRYFADNSDDLPTPGINLVYPIIMAMTSGLLLFGHIVCKQAGLVTSGIIFNTWLLLTFCGLSELYEWIQKSTDENQPSSNGRNIGFFIWWFGCFIQTLLFCFADKRSNKEIPNVELDSSFLNRLTIQWFTRLPLIGAKKDLEVQDLFEFNEGNTANYLENQWDHYWIPTMKKYNEKRKTMLVEAVVSKMNGSGQEHEKETITKKLEPPSVVYNLFKMFKYELITSFGIKVCSDVIQFANPYLLKLLLNFVSDPDAHLWQGATFALLMFGATQIRTFLLNYYIYIIFRIGIKLQSAMTAAIYRKTLKLSNIARKDKTVGEIVNLMSIDIERFQMMANQIHQYWSSPFQIVLALFFLFKTLGIAALPGVFITALFIPYTIMTSHFMRRWMVQQMKLKDERTKICNEVLNGIKVVKLYAWELPMMTLIEKIRKHELFCIFKSSLVRMTVDVFNWSTPFLVALCSFATYTLIDTENHKLTPQIAFFTLTLFNQLRFPMTMIGMLVNLTVDTLVSNCRLKEFFVADEMDQQAIDKTSETSEKDDLIDSNKADFSWDISHDSPEASTAIANLKDITMQISRGSLVAVVGRVGAGKSSLLSAMLGEMEKLRGTMTVRGKIAYVPQQAWIQNLTLKDNILFGQPFNQKFYDKVIEACALEPDLLILPNGDQTEIGEKGINLSGGQKARISLARAIYQNCDIYFLDDPLSAVDSHVGKHIFNKAIGSNGLLRNKTRILVTHGITFLKHVDRILMVEDGTFIGKGMFDDLFNVENSKLAQLMAAGKEDDDNSSKSEETTPTPSIHEKLQLKNFDEEGDEYDEPPMSAVADGDNELANAVFDRQISTTSVLLRSSIIRRTTSISSSTSPTKKFDIVEEKTEKSSEKLITKETVETGRVKRSVYWEYIRACGIIFMGIYGAFYVVYQGVMMIRNFWLSEWADDNDPNKLNKNPLSNNTRLAVYALLGVVEMLSLAIAFVGMVFGTLRASRNLHRPVLFNIMRSPMSFFDTTPVGRILNRLSKDVETVDMKLPMSFRFFMMCLTQVGFTIIIICVTTPIFTAVIIPLTLIYVISLRYYVPTSRQLKRLESNNRSPIYSHFGETIQGAAVIRAFGRGEDFCDTMSGHIDKFCHVKYMNLIANRWLAIRLEFVGNLVVFFAAMFAVFSNYWGWVTSAGLVGLSISYALNITEVLNFGVRQVSELETNIVSVERLKEYVETETEAPWKIDGKEPPKEWPNQGKIQFVNYSTRYRPGLDLVVKNINANILPGEKIGIVGRTGAGKSSLTLALFRMVEAAEGQISIDGIVVAEIGLHDLRSNVTIIPQDPVLFSGSLRFNLDPFDKYTDDAIWNALELAHLKNFVSSLPDGLEHKITEGGEDISVGQRQLVCLARALLRRSKVLVLDEATAAIDLETDALIQETIRSEFKESTIFTIAHRLNTILDYDRILILDKGEIKELDSPENLLANKDSIFSAMLADAQQTHKTDAI